jgi:hypothetical protein
MGGLISLYAFFRAPDTFGYVGAMSPSLWFASRAILSYIENDGSPPGRIYLDAGTEEGPATLRDARHLARILERKGYEENTALRFVEAVRGQHTEAHWARRLVPALEFLLRPVGSVGGRRSSVVSRQSLVRVVSRRSPAVGRAVAARGSPGQIPGTAGTPAGET